MMLEYATKLKGHINLSNTKIYAKIVNEELDKVMEVFNLAVMIKVIDFWVSSCCLLSFNCTGSENNGEPIYAGGIANFKGL